MPEALPPGLEQFGVGALLIVVIGWVAHTWITTNAKKQGVPRAHMDTDQLIRIIQENTEINARLVSAVEQQTRVIQDLATAVNKLLGKLDG